VRAQDRRAHRRALVRALSHRRCTCAQSAWLCLPCAVWTCAGYGGLGHGDKETQAEPALVRGAPCAVQAWWAAGCSFVRLPVVLCVRRSPRKRSSRPVVHALVRAHGLLTGMPLMYAWGGGGQVEAFADNGIKIASVSCGSRHSLAIDTNGTVRIVV
jgi:hypothetical protein